MENTEGTVAYLELIQCGMRAYVDDKITLSDRLFDAVYVTYFIRLWRNDLRERKIPMENFITQSCFEGIEMNLLWSLRLIIDGRAQNISENSSQQCESLFRHIRSMTGAQQTQINCTPKMLLSRLHKIELAERIMFELKNEVEFPALEQREKRHQSSESSIPEEEMMIIIESGISAAIERAKELGIYCGEIDLSKLLKVSTSRGTRDESPIRTTITAVLDSEEEEDEINESLVLQSVEFCDEVSGEKILF
jgi:hypothetical protein